jgi:hypothetical protein
MLQAHKDTPRQHKQRLERNIVYASISLQTILSFCVVGFCIHQLSRCPISLKGDDDSACPTALYTNIITGTVAMWFPSPYYGIINGLYGITPSESGARSVRKKTSVEVGIEEDK